MRNQVKTLFWWMAAVILVAEVILLLAGEFIAVSLLGLVFQGSCLMFMLEDIK